MKTRRVDPAYYTQNVVHGITILLYPGWHHQEMIQFHHYLHSVTSGMIHGRYCTWDIISCMIHLSKCKGFPFTATGVPIAG